MRYNKLDIVQIPLSGTCLIEASAGTGKTHTIANLFLRLILEQALEVRKILVVTFTEAATKELRDRIRRNLNTALRALDDPRACPDETVGRIIPAVLKTTQKAVAAERLHRAVICFDEASIFTIHGFCKRVLDENAFESAIMFDTALVTDQAAFIQEITDDFWRRRFADSTFFLNAVADRKGLTYQSLTALAGSLISKPTLTLVPAAAGTSAEDLTRLHAELKSEWQASKEDLIPILHSEKSGFKKNGKPFHGGKLNDWLTQLESACSDRPSPEDIGSIGLFTTEYLKGRLKKGFDLPGYRFFDLCQAYVEAENDYVIWMKLQYADYLKTDLARRKQAVNVQSFDDLLTAVHNALASDPGSPLARAIRNKFDAALIDEFQDTDPIQYGIFKTAFNRPGGRLFLIGDPKQAIYGFRGADVFAYLQAAAEIPAEQTYTLTENWRSASDLVAATNYLFHTAADPFVLEKTIVYHPVRAAEKSGGNRKPLHIEGGPAENLILWVINRSNAGDGAKNPNKDQARDAAAGAAVCEIARLLDLAARGQAALGDRPVRPSDIAILVTRNVDAQLFKDELGALQIPAVITRSENIFATEEAREVEYILTAVALPGNPVNLSTALATDLLGCSADTIRAYAEDEAALPEYERHMDRFTKYHDMWQTQGFIRMFRSLLADYDVRRNLLAHSHGERQLTNVLHLSELIHAAAFENGLGLNGILTWVAEQKLTEEESEAQELRLERDDEAVQILTVFRSKGLQYPIVFCPFMWQQNASVSNGDSLFYHAADRLCLDIGAEDPGASRRNRATMETLSELVRLLYVAITRAANRCYLSCGRIGQPVATALDYILTGGGPGGIDVCPALTDALKNLDEAAYFSAVQQYLGDSEGLIRLADCRPGQPAADRPAVERDGRELTCRIFDLDRRIVTGWRIASFSMLAAQGNTQAHGYKPANPHADEFPTPTVAGQAPAPDTFFAFPGGVATGSCIHAIFENLDFAMASTDYNRVLITRMLKRYGLAESASRAASVYRMVSRVVNTPLIPGQPDFQLGRIPEQHRLPEMEFYYPVKRFAPDALKHLFSRFTESGDITDSAFSERINRLEFRPIEGFMRGFIDLVFCHDDKYYLLDWKTNNLGNTYADYEVSHLAQNMAAALYNLQYYIYTVALHKYLENRIPDYAYDTHFGGVFYLFVRGIHPEHPGSGVFYDRPPKDLVEALCNLFGL